MNVEMDKVAQQTIEVGTQGPARYQILGQTMGMLYEQQATDIQNCNKLRDQINTITIKAHWDKKIQYKTGNCSMMDFEMAGQALQSLPKTQQQWVAKSVARFLCYGTNMKR